MEHYLNLDTNDIAGERWKQFHEGQRKIFLVSDYGRIKTVTKLNKVERIKTQKISNTGRPYINITSTRVEHVSRLVAKAFIRNPKNLPVVAHNNNNPKNNCVDNLRWDTQLGNMQQAWEENRMKIKVVPTVVLTRKAEMVGQFGTFREAFDYIGFTYTTVNEARSVDKYVVMTKSYYNELSYDELLHVCQCVNYRGEIKEVS
ncbi:hypothetical protein [Bacillus sp. PK5-004]